MSTIPAVDASTEARVHRGVEIEWWYTFGFLADRWTILACVWRYPGRNGGQGLMAAYALTEMREPRRRQGTWVDAHMLRAARDQLRAFRKQTTDPVVDAVIEAIGDGQAFAPYRRATRASLASTEARPLDAAVGPIRLRQDAGDATLRLRVEDGDLDLDLAFGLGTPRFPIGGSGAFEIEGRAMAGYTHPACRTSGTVTIGGRRERVLGKTWFDHQWGQWRLEHATLRHQHPEWRYFGALLDDGRSLNLYLPERPGAHGREPAPSRGLAAVLSAPDGSFETLDRVRVVPRETIESLRTHNRYEYGWRVELPGRAALEFEPFHPHHEVPVFLYQRGLLELGCRISGTLDGTRASGVGFVESFGHSMDVHTFFWGQHKTHLALELERFLPRVHDPAWLARVCGTDAPLVIDGRAVEQALIDPIWSMMDRGGKGWRSVWLMTCCHALGHDQHDERVRELLPVVEMLHTGSLVIDDVQDGSALRRGRDALHVEIGTDLAINAGNFLYFLPFVIVEEARWLTEVQRARVYHVILNALRQGHVGQGMDLMTTRGRYDLAAKLADFEATRRELLEQYRLKSGCQLESIARIAGILAGAPEERVEAIARYSRAFGVLFQVVDDLIDVQEGREKLGKDEGEDLKNGRLNVLLLTALRHADPHEREILKQALGEGNGAVRFETVRDIVRRTEAAERCLEHARAMIDQAWREMACVPTSDATLVMRSVPLWLLEQRRAKTRAIADESRANGHASR